MRRRLALVALLAGCVLPSFDGPSWRDQLVPDDPCYDVDLLDGLDESSTAELRALYDCVDQGQLTPVAPAVDALEAPTRAGDAAGIDVARVVNRLPDAGLDPFAIAGAAFAALTEGDHDASFWVDPVIELVYGVPAARARAGAVDPADPDDVAAGALVPAIGALSVAAGAALDAGADPIDRAGAILGGDAAPRWVRGIDAMARASDDRVAEPIAALPRDLGRLLAAARADGRDRWTGADDSLEGTLDVLVGERRLLDDLDDPLLAMLGDDRVRSRLPGRLADWSARGHLAEAPAQLDLLASMDVDGRALAGGEPSALHALLRLLHDTNRPVRCRVDLGLTDFDVNLGNLAVTLLEWIADQDPNDVEGLAGLIGALVGAPVASDVIDAVASSGVCDGITPQVAHDLRVVDRLGDGRVHDLVVIFVELLRELRAGEASRVPDLADAATIAVDGGLVPPADELVRDVAAEPAIVDALALVPVLYTPRAYGLGDDALTLDDALDLVVAAIDDREGDSAWQALAPVIVAVVDDRAGWRAVGRVADVLSDRDSALAGAPAYLAAWVDADPDLVLLDTAAAIAGDRAVAEPALLVLDTPAVAAAWQDPGDAAAPSPVGFVGGLAVDGTLDDVFRMIDLVLGALRA